MFRMAPTSTHNGHRPTPRERRRVRKCTAWVQAKAVVSRRGVRLKESATVELDGGCIVKTRSCFVLSNSVIFIEEKPLNFVGIWPQNCHLFLWLRACKAFAIWTFWHQVSKCPNVYYNINSFHYFIPILSILPNRQKVTFWVKHPVEQDQT